MAFIEGQAARSSASARLRAACRIEARDYLVFEAAFCCLAATLAARFCTLAAAFCDFAWDVGAFAALVAATAGVATMASAAIEAMSERFMR
jgi:hypothetical protein